MDEAELSKLLGFQVDQKLRPRDSQMSAICWIEITVKH